MQYSEQELERRKSRELLLVSNINPYPISFDKTHSTKEILQNFESDPENYQSVAVAGRLMSRRIMGSASFAEIQDQDNRIQIYITRDDLASSVDTSFYNEIFKKRMDIGDIVGVKGFAFKTKVGEISIHVQELILLSKSLKPLPIVKEVVDEEGNKKTYDAFSDPEQRYRQRYLDLIVNPKIKDVFIKRTQIVNTIREVFNKRNYLEVETPILQPLYGGAAAKPFKTHHNTLDTTLYLRISNELYLKRLIVGGFEGVYEFSKDFRNEGTSKFHNPEFTQVELYVAYKDYLWMMDLMEETVETIALKIHKSTKIKVSGNVIDFKRPWKRFTMYEAVQHFTGVDISSMNLSQLQKLAEKFGIEINASMGKGKIIDEIFGEKCEPNLIQPTFITDYPIETSPLTKKHRSKKGLVERFEVMCNGKEIMNAYSELNDPVDQRKRLEDQIDLGKHGDEEAMVLDEDFLAALEHGMPPTAGVGLGIDRLTMIMTDSPSIREVLFFPQMKSIPKGKILLSEDEKIIMKKLSGDDQGLPLKSLKGQLQLSNKKWDKAIKSLRNADLVNVYKEEEMMIKKN